MLARILKFTGTDTNVATRSYGADDRLVCPKCGGAVSLTRRSPSRCEIASNCDPLPRLKHLIDYS